MQAIINTKLILEDKVRQGDTIVIDAADGKLTASVQANPEVTA